MKTFRASRNTLALSISVTLSCPVALAQESGFALEEIVVTARKREENLQQTPIAVSAFSGEQLARSGIFNISDFNKAVPGMEVQAGNGVAGVANIYIRGVGQRNTEPNVDSGVGIYLDGVYISRADGALLDMNDVGSVQVLRGPQGTLFGKNTTGGALLIETNRPSEELEGKVSVTLGNYNQLDGALVVNLPLIDDTLYTRLSLMSINRDGYIHNTTLGTDYNDADRMSGIWQLRWLASENLSADLNLNYAKTRQRPRGLQCSPSSENFGSGWLATLQNGAIKPSHGGKSVEDLCLDSAATDKDTIIQDLGGGYDAENKGASVTLDWDLGDNMGLKSISAWRNTVAGQADDLDPLAIPFQHRSNQFPFARDRDTDQYSQEFDFTGETGALTYIAGLYYFKEETTDSRTVGITGPFFIVNPAIPAIFDAVSYTANATGLATDNESYAAFLQSDWAFGEKWKLTTGIRYTKETRELERTSYLPVISTISTTGTVIPTSGIFLMPKGTFNPDHDYEQSDYDRDDVDDDAWTPLASLSYQLTGRALSRPAPPTSP
ncbi:MAG: TonB-dependent receptor [Gammaproteobacteria bacterium]|nr:TonB-dependent receptor [Gammaproteobacteria bacterium]